MNKIILDGKEIKLEELPDGSVVAFREKLLDKTYNNMYGEITTKFGGKGIISGGLHVPFSDKTQVELVEIYHIQGYKKMYMATNKLNETYLFEINPDKKAHDYAVENPLFESEVIIGHNILDQTFNDDPWECWVKV